MRCHYIYYIVITLLIISCQSLQMDYNNIDIQGHRGCRGLLPENSIPAFIKAIDLGVSTLEMDVVISKDHQVVVSHEPWISDEICIIAVDFSSEERSKLKTLKQDKRNEIIKRRQDSIETNLYNLNYVDIVKFDCGSKPHPRFPNQDILGVSKPLLSEVINASEQYTLNGKLPSVNYNIEIKRKKEHDLVFHPKMETFADLVVSVINKSGIKERVTLQCFDIETLQYLNQKYPEFNLVFLVENKDGIAHNLDKLGFIPSIYSPDFSLLDEAAIQYAQERSIKVIPWTVNELDDMQRMIDLKVDGIISDYPDRLISIINKRSK